MRRAEQRQGLRMLKLRDVLSRREAGSLSLIEATELLGMSEANVAPLDAAVRGGGGGRSLGPPVGPELGTGRSWG
jgi:hypothetical protein